MTLRLCSGDHILDGTQVFHYNGVYVTRDTYHVTMSLTIPKSQCLHEDYAQMIWVACVTMVWCAS